MASFPTSLDNLITTVSASEYLGLAGSGLGIATILNNVSTAINSLETKVGVDGSAVVTTLDYLLKNVASIDPGHHHTNTSLDSLASSKVSGLPTFPAGTIVGTTDTQTLTNKRVTPRTDTVVSSATPSINTDTTDEFTITALAVAITSMTTGLSGTPTEGQKLIIRILDNGTPRAITWGASFISRGATLPTTTTANKITYVGLIYNAVAAVWDCVATVTEA